MAAQPRHANFIWYNEEGNLQVGKNRAAAWNVTRASRYTWGEKGYFWTLMNEAQKNLDSYRLSEKMRLVSRLVNPGDRFEIMEDAMTTCPLNYRAWTELLGAIEEPNGVKARGTVYSTKGLLRAKLRMSLQKFPLVVDLLEGSIDGLDYED
jgi:hypothetical protein